MAQPLYSLFARVSLATTIVFPYQGYSVRIISGIVHLTKHERRSEMKRDKPVWLVLVISALADCVCGGVTGRIYCSSNGFQLTVTETSLGPCIGTTVNFLTPPIFSRISPTLAAKSFWSGGPTNDYAGLYVETTHTTNPSGPNDSLVDSYRCVAYGIVVARVSADLAVWLRSYTRVHEITGKWIGAEMPTPPPGFEVLASINLTRAAKKA